MQMVNNPKVDFRHCKILTGTLVIDPPADLLDTTAKQRQFVADGGELVYRVTPSDKLNEITEYFGVDYFRLISWTKSADDLIPGYDVIISKRSTS